MFDHDVCHQTISSTDEGLAIKFCDVGIMLQTIKDFVHCNGPYLRPTNNKQCTISSKQYTISYKQYAKMPVNISFLFARIPVRSHKFDQRVLGVRNEHKINWRMVLCFSRLQE